MKPPPRKRAKVDRNLVLEPVSRSSLSKWQQPEKRKLLKALHKLSKTSGGNVDIDYSFLQTCVLTRSMSEIQGVVESLKEKVISGTLCELNKWKAERKLRKPIEIWTELAFSVTGSHEEHISTAFSQMLMVSSTEPCTLTYCDPPQVHRPLTVTLLGCTVPPKPRPRASLQARAVTSRASPGNQQFAVPSPAAENSPRPPSENSAATTHSADASSVQQPASPQPPLTNPDVATSGMPVSVATHDDPSLSQSAAAVSRNATKDTPRTPGIKCVADFEKIYRYLSEVHKPDKVCNLTPMESAIVLDLLMSLPEELLLLDCNKLHKHLIQVYKCLSSPADSKEAKEMLEKLKSTFAGQAEEAPSSRAGKDAMDQQSAEAAADGGPQSQQNGSAPNQNTPEPSTSTDVTGFSPPPLNPFMIPLEMLMRQ